MTNLQPYLPGLAILGVVAVATRKALKFVSDRLTVRIIRQFSRVVEQTNILVARWDVDAFFSEGMTMEQLFRKREEFFALGSQIEESLALSGRLEARLERIGLLPPSEPEIDHEDDEQPSTQMNLPFEPLTTHHLPPSVTCADPRVRR
jgi:hypothetical protein